MRGRTSQTIETSRGQSHVVGVALMLSLAVVALGGLTMGVGTVLDSQASNADAERVATTMDDALQSTERTGQYSHELQFADGTLAPEERTVRVLDENGDVIQEYQVGALVFDDGTNRVVSVAGAVIRGEPGNAWFVSEPPITSSERTGALVIGVPVLGVESGSLSGQGGVRTTVRTNVSHTEQDLPTGEYAVAIETETPEPFERYFAAQNASTERQSFTGDERDSVVATYQKPRDAVVVVHDLALEVGNG